MILLSTEMTFQIQILTFSLVLTDCLCSHDIYSWSNINFSYILLVLIMRSLIVTRETYRVSPFLLGSVPPGICSFTGSDSAIALNHTRSEFRLHQESHSRNSAWVGVLVSTVCPLPRHGRFPSGLPPATRSTGVSAQPPTNNRFRFADVSASASKVFLSLTMWALISVCTSKKRFR